MVELYWIISELAAVLHEMEEGSAKVRLAKVLSRLESDFDAAIEEEDG